MDIVLAAAVTLSCADGAWILSGLVDSDIPKNIKSEIRTEIIQTMPDNCLHEEYNPTSRSL